MFGLGLGFGNDHKGLGIGLGLGTDEKGTGLALVLGLGTYYIQTCSARLVEVTRYRAALYPLRAEPLYTDSVPISSARNRYRADLHRVTAPKNISGIEK